MNGQYDELVVGGVTLVVVFSVLSPLGIVVWCLLVPVMVYGVGSMFFPSK